MKIGYEAKRAFLNMTGLGNYSREVIRMMASNYPDNEYLLYTPKVKTNNRLGFLSGFAQIKTILPKSKLFTSWWRSRGVVADLKRDGVQVYHGLSHELPIGIHQTRIRSVVTIHDLIFMRFPQYFGFVSRQIYYSKIKYACTHTNSIIAISERTKTDIIELLGTDPAKIEVIYQGCDDSFKVKQSLKRKTEVKQKYHLPDHFILNVGTIEPRKNLLVLIKALPLLPHVKLVVIGRQSPYFKQVRQYIVANGLEKRIIFIDNVQFDELPAIYQLANVFVYPSRYEGFGIPILEALASGTPVIAATGSCLEEAGGPDSLYIDPDDENALAEKISLIMTDSVVSQTMVEKGMQYSAKFEEKKLAAQMMGVYQKVLKHA
ncbi:glycosyltransferase family 4 protein [Mucilaginibacter sp. HMF5004]|uniref:glycosyltransferase family 4 protein n=1 Tax=Mucilaginibacter rivuli TaxID=2857527 RepID=UPI001C606B42|nr:glycosyltransferase family 1 protein [Mucilaginibacter rivuli]MBW4890848.1 glycosyltransferase family 4 protein [Mucilaginibacter rivuli]